MAPLRVRAVLLALVLALGASGCGGGDDDKETTLGASDLKGFLITPADLPDGYKVQTEQDSTDPQKCVGGTSARARAVGAKFEELGLQACTSSTYRKRREGAINKNNTPGATVIAMKSEDDAKKALPELRKALVASYKPSGTASAGQQDEIPVSDLGEESLPGVKLTTDLGALGGDFDLYIYVWRRDNVLVWMGSTDILGDFDEESTLTLAKKIDGRIAGDDA